MFGRELPRDVPANIVPTDSDRHPGMYKTLVLLRIDAAPEPIFFVVEGVATWEGDGSSLQDRARYLYEEHTCPMNVIGWDGPVVMVMTPTDDDPHGMFKHVRSVWMTTDWSGEVDAVEERDGVAWGEQEAYLHSLFPEIKGTAPVSFKTEEPAAASYADAASIQTFLHTLDPAKNPAWADQKQFGDFIMTSTTPEPGNSRVWAISPGANEVWDRLRGYKLDDSYLVDTAPVLPSIKWFDPKNLSRSTSISPALQEAVAKVAQDFITGEGVFDPGLVPLGNFARYDTPRPRPEKSFVSTPEQLNAMSRGEIVEFIDVRKSLLTHDEVYRAALAQCGERYAEMAEDSLPVLASFIQEFRDGVPTLPLLKLNRWLGYIQGTLIGNGNTTVEAERDWTRPLFRPLDFADAES